MISVKRWAKLTMKFPVWQKIPFLPISFFKTHRVCAEKPIVHVFESSVNGWKSQSTFGK